LDTFLNKLFPEKWVPLYSMVTFSRTRYSEVVEKRNQQDRLISTATKLSVTTLVAGLALVALNWNRVSKIRLF
jgi:kynurenine 3-monooxygenase